MREYRNHFELKFDVKTNDDNLVQLLRAITDTVRVNPETHLEGYMDIEVFPTVTILTGTADD